MTEDPLVRAYVAGILLGFLLGMPVVYAVYLGWWRSETKRLSKVEEEKDEG